MRNLFITFFLIVFLISCGGESNKDEDKNKSVDNIEIKSIKDACDCVREIGFVGRKTLEFVDANGGVVDEMEKIDFQKFESMIQKNDAIMLHCIEELKVSWSEMEGCDGFDKTDKIMKKIQQL